MRELALVTYRLVDNDSRLSEGDIVGWYTPDYTDHDAVKAAEKVTFDHLFSGGPGEAVPEPYYRPRAEMAIIRVEPCNPDSELGHLLLHESHSIICGCLHKLSVIGQKRLNSDNTDRHQLDLISRGLGGSGIESTDTNQFYAVFDVSQSEDEKAEVILEGLLRLDQIDMCIQEAVMLP